MGIAATIAEGHGHRKWPARPLAQDGPGSGCDTRTTDLELIHLDDPSETRRFEKGRFDVYRVGPTVLGRATYEPGWRWSEHVAPTVGTESCQVEHVGLVLSGQAVARMDDGTERLMRAGDFFYVPPGHDSWVVGDEPYVSLHILGSEEYALPGQTGREYA
jgi:quercetin dioxygenase-like cupin family protein